MKRLLLALACVAALAVPSTSHALRIVVRAETCAGAENSVCVYAQEGCPGGICERKLFCVIWNSGEAVDP